jgi:hypothetical protein
LVFLNKASNMEDARRQRLVEVNGQKFAVTLSQSSEAAGAIWWAWGDYGNKRLTGMGGTEDAALNDWRRRAIELGMI